MWAFNGFPAQLKVERKYSDGPEYEIEVFGYVNKSMVMFRRTAIGISRERGEVELLPVEEFEERFKEYKLEEI